jgi:hypothetical protein
MIAIVPRRGLRHRRQVDLVGAARYHRATATTQLDRIEAMLVTQGHKLDELLAIGRTTLIGELNMASNLDNLTAHAGKRDSGRHRDGGSSSRGRR